MKWEKLHMDFLQDKVRGRGALSTIPPTPGKLDSWVSAEESSVGERALMTEPAARSTNLGEGIRIRN